MDATRLGEAYHELLAAAEAITDETSLPSEVRSTIDWTLSHVALSDRILAHAAREVLTGIPPVVDNSDAMDEAAIASLIARTTHGARVALVRYLAADLMTVVRTIPEHAAGTPVLLRITGRDGTRSPERVLPWHELMRLRATEHLPGHAARLAVLATAR